MKIGFVFDPLEIEWDEAFHLLTIFKEREGHCRVLSHHKENGFSLGQWLFAQRRNRGSLSRIRQQKLDALGMEWAPTYAANWERGFRYLMKYHSSEGHCRVPDGHREDEFNLGSWVAVQRRNKDRLSEERQLRLNELGFVWDPMSSAWEEGFHHLIVYKEREGHCRVPKKHIEAVFPLGQWVGSQRGVKETLTEERRQRLDELEFVWDPLAADWEEGFSCLKAYKEREGHCRVPYGHIENRCRLGTWVDTQRRRRSKGRMSQHRMQRLDELGFVWDPHEADWEDGLEHLRAFVNEHKHCQVDQQYKSPDGYNLGNWVSNKRRRGPVSAERKARLDALGFDWKVAD